jgi:hypothetical protein
MTTPAKNAPAKPAPAKAPAKTAPAKKAAPAFDFANLGEAQATSAPRRQVGPPIPPNVLGALQDSWAKRERMAQIYREGKPTGEWTYRGEGKSWTVPADVAPVLEATIRRAGVQLGYGTSIKLEDAGNGNTRVVFCAKTAKSGKSNKE